jgi:Zn-dependent protease
VRFDPTQLLMLPVCVLSLIVHECAHALAAMACGDPTPRERGRLTLNPMPHLSWIGSLLVPALLLGFHAPILFGWARPVPVSFGNLENPRNDPVKVALAGPLANLLLAIAFAAMARFAPPHGFFAPLAQLGIAGVLWNCSVGLLNLVPIPPLDGSWLLMRFLRLRHIIALQYFRGIALLLFAAMLAWPMLSSLVFLNPLRLAVRACLALFGGARLGITL